VREIVDEAYCRYIGRIGKLPGPMLEDYAARIAARQTWVIEEARIQGVLVLTNRRDVLLLDNIAIRPDAQGRGYGRRLLAFAENTAREAGYNGIELYTHELMTENQALYRRIGYVETGRVTEEGFQRVYMRKLFDPEGLSRVALTGHSGLT